MTVDVQQLRSWADGDPSSKVAVTRRWLSHVADELSELERLRAAQRPPRSGDGMGDIFDNIFGGGRRR